MSRLAAPFIAVLLLASLLLAGCRRDDTPAAAGDPVAAVAAQVQALRDNDLLRYSQISVPPDVHARLQARWAEHLRVAPGPDEEARAEFARTLARLTAPDAEQALFAAFEKKIAPLESEIAGQWPMLQATATIFLKAAVEANDTLDSAEKAHANAVVAALLGWLQPELLIDRDRARQAIAELTRTTRALEFVDIDQMRALPFDLALQKAGVALAGLKRIGRIYGLDADAALAQAKTELVRIDGTTALVKVSYPLLGETIAFELEMVAREDRWYSANALREAEEELAEPLPAAADIAPGPVTLESASVRAD